MKFLVNGQLYDVRFRTNFRADHFGRTEVPLKDIRCTVSTVDESIEGAGKYECVGEGTAYMSHRDVADFDKWAGRKVAFTRALSRFSKEDRAEFWRIYKEAYPGRKFDAKISMDGCKKDNSVKFCVRKIEDLPVQPRQTKVAVEV